MQCQIATIHWICKIFFLSKYFFCFVSSENWKVLDSFILPTITLERVMKTKQNESISSRIQCSLLVFCWDTQQLLETAAQETEIIIPNKRQHPLSYRWADEHNKVFFNPYTQEIFFVCENELDEQCFQSEWSAQLSRVSTNHKHIIHITLFNQIAFFQRMNFLLTLCCLIEYFITQTQRGEEHFHWKAKYQQRHLEGCTAHSEVWEETTQEVHSEMHNGERPLLLHSTSEETTNQHTRKYHRFYFSGFLSGDQQSISSTIILSSSSSSSSQSTSTTVEQKF